MISLQVLEPDISESKIDITSIQQTMGGVVNSVAQTCMPILVSLFMTTAPIVEPVRTPSVMNITELYVSHQKTIPSERARLIRQLDKVASLPKGWNNDEHAVAIDTKAIASVRELLLASTEKELKGWSLFPDPIGAICLDYASGDLNASFSIGQKGFSFIKYSSLFFESVNYLEVSVYTLHKLLKDVSC